MGLAIVEQIQAPADGNRHRPGRWFRVETGSNRWFSWLIGEKETYSQSGIRTLENVRRKSRPFGPVRPEQRNQAHFMIPLHFFDRKNRYVQVVTYHDQQGTNPIWSDIITIIDYEPQGDLPNVLPMSIGNTPAHQQTTNTDFRYRELSPYSEAYGLMDFLKKSAKHILPVAGAAVAQMKGKNEKQKANLQKAADLLQDEDVVNAVDKIVNAIGTKKEISKEEEVEADENAEDEMLTEDELQDEIEKTEDEFEELEDEIQAEKEAIREGLAAAKSWTSRGMALPAIPVIDAVAKAAPAFAPAVEKAVEGVTNPEFIKAVGENFGPNKLAEATFGFFRDFLGTDVDMNITLEDMTKFGENTQGTLNMMLKGYLMKQMNESKQEHELEKMKVAKGMSTVSPKALKKAGMAFLPTKKVSLSLNFHGKRDSVANLSTLQFAYGKAISLPLSVETPAPIRKAALRVYFRELKSGKIRFKKQFLLQNVQNGKIDAQINFSPEELKDLHANEEHLLSVRLIWPNKRKQRLGTALTKVISLVSSHTFEAVKKPVGAPIPLNDIQQNRAFWHKIWATTFEDGRTEHRWDAKYYLTTGAQNAAHQRMETVMKEEPAEAGSRAGKLKSGLEVSISALNQLIPDISPYPALSDAERFALDNSNFDRRFTQMGRKKVKLWGAGGDSAALWVWPELQMHEVVLKVPEAVNEHGLVQKFGTKTVYFPLPVAVHFVGTKLS